ncbi:MAG: hypothetical protein JRG86_00060 [Deltaproteobacteria bacterium]|jgi:hypothetical protein|nr:hypothetical protein [Deltaproteobacteria bacterium]MBW2495738.1 hypothetical protein [Deltaproteobacteria bacterium]
MASQRRLLIAINLLGGVAVLGSYAYCLSRFPGNVGAFWGDLPHRMRPLYTVNMFLAALGYFAFSFFLLFRLDSGKRLDGRSVLGRFNFFYALILLPSALWMPLTFMMLDSPAVGIWWAIRLVLALVGIGSLGLLAGLVLVRPSEPSAAWRLSIAGAMAFSLQTALLDAIVWPAFFPI